MSKFTKLACSLLGALNGLPEDPAERENRMRFALIAAGEGLVQGMIYLRNGNPPEEVSEELSFALDLAIKTLDGSIKGSIKAEAPPDGDAEGPSWEDLRQSSTLGPAFDFLREAYPPSALDALWDEVVRLHKADARHKRGFLLSSRAPADALWHLVEEVSEVGRATSDDERAEELADTLKIVMHYVLRAGLSMQDVAERGLRKLPSDFPSAYPEGA